MDIAEIEQICGSNDFWAMSSGEHLNMIHSLLEHIDGLKIRIVELEDMLPDYHPGDLI